MCIIVVLTCIFLISFCYLIYIIATPRRSPTSNYKVTSKGTPNSYGNKGKDPNPTGFISPVTYNRKFDQIVGDMEVTSQVRIEEALREQRDRHADALERVSVR